MSNLVPAEREALIRIIDTLWNSRSARRLDNKLMLDFRQHVGDGTCRDLANRLRAAFNMKTNREGGIPVETKLADPASPAKPVKGYAVVLDEDLVDEESMHWIHGLLLQVKGVKEVVPLESDPSDQVTAERIKHELFEKVHQAFFPKGSL